MATNNIPINTTTRLGGKLRSCVDSTTGVMQLMKQLEDIMVQQIDGSVYTEVEQQFGLDSGDGQTVYNLLAGAYAAMNVSAIQQFTSRMG